MDEEREYLISQLIDECQNISLSTEFRNHIVDVLSSPNFPIDQLRILAASDISFLRPDPIFSGMCLNGTERLGE